MSLLAVYNTCGISGKDNTDYYSEVIESLLNQSYKDLKLIVSDCLCSEYCKTTLRKRFGGQVAFSYVDEARPVNVTFNLAVIRGVGHYGKFDGYMYMDSGVRYAHDPGAIEKLYELYQSGPYGIVTPQIDVDNGYEWWFGVKELPKDKPFVIPVGKACNGQVNIFSNQLLEYYGRLMPDIFASFCTESTYSFLAAALKLKWVIANNVVLQHFLSMDGPSSLFEHERRWDHVYLLNKPMIDIIRTQDSIRWGMGYEEFRNVFMHDPSQFNEEGFCINDNLKMFIRENLFLPSNILDYNSIKGDFVA